MKKKILVLAAVAAVMGLVITGITCFIMTPVTMNEALRYLPDMYIGEHPTGVVIEIYKAPVGLPIAYVKYWGLHPLFFPINFLIDFLVYFAIVFIILLLIDRKGDIDAKERKENKVPR